MSMSIDYGKLDRVYAFADFLEILAKPEAMKQTVDEYKTQADVLKELIEKKTAVTEVDSYVAKQKMEVEELVARHTEEVNKSNEHIKTELAKLAAKEAKATALFAEAEVAKAAGLKAKEDAEARVAELAVQKADLDKLVAGAAAERKALEKERQALNAKSEQLRSVLGG